VIHAVSATIFWLLLVVLLSSWALRRDTDHSPRWMTAAIVAVSVFLGAQAARYTVLALLA
jgi:hypothetical protein